ncbi:MAG: 3-oxoadipate enol-lactonase [Pseudomonadota bacterium]
MQFVDLDGRILHCATRAGQGRPVMFLNAHGTDFRIWDGVLSHLPEVPTLCYDKQGHGLSSLVDDLTMADHVADVIALIEHFGLSDVLLCGVSVGGLIAIGVADARPDLVGALVLSNTAAKIGTPEIWAERLALVKAGGQEAIADALMDRWFSARFQRERPATVQGYRTMVVRGSRSGYLKTGEAIRDTDFRTATPRIAVPVHVLAGDEDGSIPPDIAAALAQSIPDARLTVLSDCGHLPCVQHPQEVANVIASLRV